MCNAHQYYLGCGTGHVAQMGREEVHTRFRWGNLRERDHLENLRINGGIILKCILKKRNGGGMDWIDLAQDRGRWQAVVNMVTFAFHKLWGIS